MKVKVFLPSGENKYPRVVVDSDAHLSGAGLDAAAELAVKLADEKGLPVHIQGPKQYTHLIIHPEAL